MSNIYEQLADKYEKQANESNDVHEQAWLYAVCADIRNCIENCCEDQSNIISVSGKCSDMCHVFYPDDTEHDGYVPTHLNIGGDDYLEFAFCKICGKMQGEFPIKE